MRVVGEVFLDSQHQKVGRSVGQSQCPTLLEKNLAGRSREVLHGTVIIGRSNVSSTFL
jgi:hypothetical protein